MDCQDDKKIFFVPTILNKIVKLNTSKNFNVKKSILFLKTTTSQCIYETFLLNKKNPVKIAALNFASGKKPGGGGPDFNARTQEEFLLATSPEAYNLLQQYSYFYPLRTGGLYLRDVKLTFNDNKEEIKENVLYDMMVAPALNFNNWFVKNKLQNGETIKSLIEKHMKPLLCNLIIEAIQNSCDIIILGNWGLGVFSPKEQSLKLEHKKCMEEMFKEINEKFSIFFKKIIYAII